MITSEVKGVQIRMALDEFAEMANLPSEGEMLTEMKPPVEWFEFDYLSALQRLKHYGAGSSKLTTAHQLTTENRLIHYCIVRILLPKYGNYAQVKKADILLMWAVKHEKTVNWAHLVALHMLTAKRDMTKLPYAMLITRILRNSGSNSLFATAPTFAGYQILSYPTNPI